MANTQGNDVLAVVEGTAITRNDLMRTLNGLGNQKQKYMSPEGQQSLLQEMINQELFYLEALADKLDETETFQTELEQMKKTLLKQYAVERLMTAEVVTEEEIADYYKQYAEYFNGQEAVTASHILMATEEEIKKAVQEIKEGLAFEEAAAKYSLCPSKEKGGSLGEFTRGKMVPEFDAAVFEMEVGEISEPLKTQFGYHIIKLDQKRDDYVYELGEIKDQLKQELLSRKQNEAYFKKAEELKGKYDIEIKED